MQMRILGRAIAVLAVLIALPFTVKLAGDEAATSSRVAIVSNDACARDRGCAFSPGSICSGGPPETYFNHQRTIT